MPVMAPMSSVTTMSALAALAALAFAIVITVGQALIDVSHGSRFLLRSRPDDPSAHRKGRIFGHALHASPRLTRSHRSARRIIEMQTAEQWAYGAILDHWDRWNDVRRAVRLKRPRRRTSAALAFALAAAASVQPRRAHR
jgi:hypothetical protein